MLNFCVTLWIWNIPRPISVLISIDKQSIIYGTEGKTYILSLYTLQFEDVQQLAGIIFHL